MGTLIGVVIALGAIILGIWSGMKESRKKENVPQDFRGDYGPAKLAPSADAKSILTSMTEEERSNFDDALAHLQKWYDSTAGDKGPVSFHPEGRAVLWGTALAKIADHFHQIGRDDRALFFTDSAWKLSKYPVFAFNAGILSMALGDHVKAKRLLVAYLNEYQKVLATSSFQLIDSKITTNELERMAQNARTRLSALDVLAEPQEDMTSSVSNPSQYADSFAPSLLALATNVAASFVGFSGETPADAGSERFEVVFEQSIEMILSGFKLFTQDVALLIKPNLREMGNGKLVNAAYRDATAFLCLYSENVAVRSMKEDNAEQFANTLYSSVAKRCAGQYGLSSEPREVFDILQNLIQIFRSDTVLNEDSFGKNDALGNVLNHLKLSEDGLTRYAFLVGSKKQPLGCAAHYMATLTEISDKIKRCAHELHW